MIITSKDNEWIMPDRSIATTRQLWRHVRLEVDGVYFLVNYRRVEGHASTNLTDILWRVEDLTDICVQIKNDPQLILSGISLLTAAAVNRTSDWKIELLSHIWLVEDDDQWQTRLYVTSEGIEHIENHQGTGSVWRRIKIVFNPADYAV